MGVRIKFDSMSNVQSPTFVLATRKGKKLGSVPAYNIVFKDCLNSYSELSFRVNKFDNDVEFRLWNQIKDFKLIYCKEWDLWFEIYVEIDEKNELTKNVIGKTISEAELSQICLYNIEINTEIDISRDDYEKPTVLYNPEYPENSLLDRITEKIPHYEIIHVDNTIMNVQKTFSFDDISIYDAFQEIAEEIGCLFVFSSGSDLEGRIKRTIEVYDLNTYCNECEYRGEYTHICPECGSKDLNYGFGTDTRIFISSENLADEITYSVNADSVKNCFKVEGGDDLINATIRNCNPNGTDYIWYISDDVKEDMSDELVEKINEYDELYSYYSEEHEIVLDSLARNRYNDLVKKYLKYNKNLQEIDSIIVGYPDLMTAYYNTIDLSVFLQSALMPSPENSGTNAEKQASLLTNTNLSPVAVTNLDSLSEATAENAILAIARTLVKSGYQVKVNDSSLAGYIWTGSFKVSNYYDEEDSAISDTISVTINDDMETYVTQKIEKALHNTETDDLSITGLFKLDYKDFCNELSKYCLDSLLIFNDSCQGALDILIEQGISADTHDLYIELYKPYYEKSKAIQEEVALREEEINYIVGKYDSNEELIESGIQNYIIDIRNDIQNELNFETFLGKTNWLEFCSYRRDNKFTNSNYISDGLDNAELFKKAIELLEVATKEIYKSAELQHTISSSLKNLLAIEEFQPLLDNFEVGNWIRMRVDNDVYKLRLLTYEIDYEDLSNIHVEFSDVLKVKNGLSDVQSIVKQATSIATSYDSVSHQASQGSAGNKRLSEWVDKGLSLTNMKIISGSDNQEIIWDNHGFLMKEYFPVTDSFSDKQLKIINKGLYVTDNAWETSRAGIGNFIYYDPRDKKTKEGYGVIADTLIGNLILGETVGIYTSTNDITLNKDGLIITNQNSGVSNPVTITMNPNNNNGVFTIQSDDDGMLMQVNNEGKLIIGDSNFVVNSDGTAEIKNIIMSGDITWDTSSNPIKVLYARDNISKPPDYDESGYKQYGSYASSSSTDWHKTLDASNDKYGSYSYDNGKTWTSAIKIKGEDGQNGEDGDDADVPLYAKPTYIDFYKVSSPAIYGGSIVGCKFIATNATSSTRINGDGDVLNKLRLVIDNNGLISYDSNNTKDGISITANNGFGSLEFYYDGELRGELSQGSGNIYLKPIQRLIIGNSNPPTGSIGDVRCVGKWQFGTSSNKASIDFTNANITGLTATFG